MITTKMWLSLERYFLFLPSGMLRYESVKEIALEKHKHFRYYSAVYFVYFSSYAICLPIHIAYRVLAIPLSIPVLAIHCVTLVLAICADTLTWVFAVTMFQGEDDFLWLFSAICNNYRKILGKLFLFLSLIF